MGQQKSTQIHIQNPRDFKHIAKNKFIAYEHQNILKLRQIPFKNSIQISKNPSLYLEDCQMTLASLLQQRYGSQKLFLQQDIQKTLNSIVCALNYLEEKGNIYPYLSCENIFYACNQSVFKLLPHFLIKQSLYQTSHKTYQLNINHPQYNNQKQFKYKTVLLSPQMIIALRFNQQQIDDDEIQQKSNVFILGMILLQMTTLLPSSDCYDSKSFDILDDVIMERFQIMNNFYSNKLKKIIKSMLEYDYSQRISIKQLKKQLKRQKQINNDQKNGFSRIVGPSCSIIIKKNSVSPIRTKQISKIVPQNNSQMNFNQMIFQKMQQSNMRLINAQQKTPNRYYPNIYSQNKLGLCTPNFTVDSSKVKFIQNDDNYKILNQVNAYKILRQNGMKKQQNRVQVENPYNMQSDMQQSEEDVQNILGQVQDGLIDSYNQKYCSPIDNYKESNNKIQKKLSDNTNILNFQNKKKFPHISSKMIANNNFVNDFKNSHINDHKKQNYSQTLFQVQPQEDYSISRIKSEIQKSRKLIKQFQKTDLTQLKTTPKKKIL